MTIRIAGIGTNLPPKVVTNDDLAEQIAAISSSAWKVRTPCTRSRLSRCRMSLAGVIG